MVRWTVAILAPMLFWPGSATAGWRGAEWGMTPEQVAMTLPEAAQNKGAFSDRIEGKTIGNVGRYVWDKDVFQSVFYFDAAGLASVALTPSRQSACKSLATKLLETHGEPLRVSDQAILKLVIWHDPKAASRVRLLLMGEGGCTLYYERLSDYEAVDKRLR